MLETTLQSALFEAIRDGNVGEMRNYLQAGAGLETRFEGLTPLCYAAECRQSASIAFLLGEGADVDGTDEDGRGPLSHACQGEFGISSSAVAQQLLDAGADPNAVDRHGKSVLMDAASTGSLPIVNMLLEREAKLDHAREGGDTALILAAWNGNAEVACRLIAAGANLNQRNNNGQDAIAAARLREFHDLAELMRTAAVERNLEAQRKKRAEEMRRAAEELTEAIVNGVAATLPVGKPIRFARRQNG